mmetsp:Transcript_6595/g.14304  ORF Transcript_6595/g.14304 Transcript_6595/m.14304 type:complete len:166 (+) Transcript_6595:97-594(+)|eukprot:CAMPEP_0171348164 /NCGR_PEP_ID=MMETSP0878-20121228/30072_1 /TAXON_ID=67004 /ORGANISM="Thalassiosira weissflogii, Strain CCMP1336" /LENGTH=165 /DNA_ID=CAMNT_0011852417 /DNA_START=181 /DNA_END=678 /DNA_ORIENTATION=+
MVAEMPPRYNANEAETIDVNEIETNHATTDPTTEHAEPSREEDAFLFYSDRSNLERALNFEEIDSTDQDLMPDPSTTARRTRITFERDSFSLFVGEFSGGDFDSDSDDDYDLDEEDIIQRIMRLVSVRRQQAKKLPQEEEGEGEGGGEATTTPDEKAVSQAATAA